VYNDISLGENQEELKIIKGEGKEY